jgi:hypothetical protein
LAPKYALPTGLLCRGRTTNRKHFATASGRIARKVYDPLVFDDINGHCRGMRERQACLRVYPARTRRMTRRTTQGKNNSIELGTGGILAIAVFLLAWNIVELGTGTGPKGAPPGTTYHAVNQAGATVTPSDRPSVLEQ